MTRQEKKEELIGLYAVGAIYIGDLIDECFEFGQQHPHWISVEDELPKEDVFVLVVCDDYVNIARRHENRWQLGFSTKTANHLIYTPYNNNITHWMPMPKSPMGIRGNQMKIPTSQQQIIGTADHIKTALDVMDKKGGEK